MGQAYSLINQVTYFKVYDLTNLSASDKQPDFTSNIFLN